MPAWPPRPSWPSGGRSCGIGRFPDAIADFDRAVEAARRLGDRRLEGVTLAYRGLTEMWDHRLETAEATLLGVVSLTGEELLEARVLASLMLSAVYTVGNRHAEADPLVAFVHVHASKLDPVGRALWGWFASRVELWAGRLDTALRLAEEGRSAAEAVMAHRLMGRWNEGHALGSKGEYEAARDVLEETVVTCERVGDVVVRVRCAAGIPGLAAITRASARSSAYSNGSFSIRRPWPLSSTAIGLLHR